MDTGDFCATCGEDRELDCQCNEPGVIGPFCVVCGLREEHPRGACPEDNPPAPLLARRAVTCGMVAR